MFYVNKLNNHPTIIHPAIMQNAMPPHGLILQNAHILLSSRCGAL
jgi:hypothetical protein